MTHWIRIRGALSLIALSIGWAIGAVACGLLADAGADSVLWAFFQRVFLALSMGFAASAMAIILCRSPREWRTTCRCHGFPCLGCLLGVAVATWWAVTSVVTTASSFWIAAVILGSLVLLDQRLPSPADELTEGAPIRTPARMVTLLWRSGGARGSQQQVHLWP